ncbi:MAG: hypothetical protein LBU17_08100 [Treponema sp.]|nr:hypothetical protein [Treponema sp.]
MEKPVILAVDDMALNLRDLKVILEKQFDVRLAKSGKIALWWSRPDIPGGWSRTGPPLSRI